MVNRFLSSVFTGAFVNMSDVPVVLYNRTGSVAAAFGAGTGSSYVVDSARQSRLCEALYSKRRRLPDKNIKQQGITADR